MYTKCRPLTANLYILLKVLVQKETLFKTRCSKIVYFVLYSRTKKPSQGPEEMCLSLEHQNPSKTSEKMGYFDPVTVSLHIL